jgi:hypothetical protein
VREAASEWRLRFEAFFFFCSCDVAMSKPSVLSNLVNLHTRELSVSEFAAKFGKVEGVPGGHVLFIMDLAALAFWVTGQDSAVVIRQFPDDPEEVTLEWLKEQVADGKLVESLQLLRKCLEELRKELLAKGAREVTIRFVAEFREADEIKTHKQRDNRPLDPERFARLGTTQRKKKCNLKTIAKWWRECCRGPEGMDLLAGAERGSVVGGRERRLCGNG